MGWKNLKQHYRIVHTVCVTEEGICIGSAYIHNIIVVGLDGKIKKRDDGRNNEDLRRYIAEFDSNPAMLKEFILAPDDFEKDLPVFTYEGDKIIEKNCEAYGWPNCTHDGELMYDNMFSPDKRRVIEWARHNAELEVEALKEKIQRIEIDRQGATVLLKTAMRNLFNLNAMGFKSKEVVNG